MRVLADQVWRLWFPCLVAATACFHPVPTALAEEIAAPQLLHATQLRDEGHPQAVIALLEPLVQPDAHILNASEVGVAWNLLGSAYQDLEAKEQARRCYETAIQRLRPLQAAQAQYAAAIDNLGSLAGAAGDLETARALLEKARRLYQLRNDHTGLAINASSLALITLEQGQVHAARRNLSTVRKEIQAGAKLGTNDQAALATVKGSLAVHDGKYQDGIAAFQQAIDLWTQAHGQDFPLLGTGYALRANAYFQYGNYSRALADTQRALSILGDASAQKSREYLKVQLFYASVLRALGASQEAKLYEKQAGNALREFDQRQCTGCTISVESLR